MFYCNKISLFSFYEFYNNLVYSLEDVFSSFRYSSLVLVVNYIVFCIILLHANIQFTLYSFARFNLLVVPVYFWLVLFHCCCNFADGFEFQINCFGKSLNPSRSCRWLPRPVTNTLSISAKLIITLLTLWTKYHLSVTIQQKLESMASVQTSFYIQ